MGKKEKRCPMCKAIKQIGDFYHDKQTVSGYAVYCKSCEKTKHQKYYKNGGEKVKISARKWQEKNQEKAKSTRKIYRKNNSKKILESVQKWKKNNPEKVKAQNKRNSIKRLSFPAGKLNNRISADIREALQGGKKRRKWSELVGYNAEQLKQHLEKQFIPGMTWANYGLYGWHIDHKIPKSVFNYTNPNDIDFKKCWSLENLQPMWAKDNLIKRDHLNTPFQPSLAIGG